MCMCEWAALFSLPFESMVLYFFHAVWENAKNWHLLKALDRIFSSCTNGYVMYDKFHLETAKIYFLIKKFFHTFFEILAFVSTVRQLWPQFSFEANMWKCNFAVCLSVMKLTVSPRSKNGPKKKDNCIGQPQIKDISTSQNLKLFLKIFWRAFWAAQK